MNPHIMLLVSGIVFLGLTVIWERKSWLNMGLKFMFALLTLLNVYAWLLATGKFVTK